MSRFRFLWSIPALAILAVAGVGGWLLSLPAATATAAAPPVPQAETQAMLAALKPTKRERPLVAVVGINDATETTDYLMPAGILRRADVAEVMMVASGPGVVKLYPALAVEADATLAEFDRRHPDGADYVVVPAMSRDDDPAVLSWLQAQAGKGAIVIGICAGAKIVAAAGLLDGKRATTHWYYRHALFGRSPTAAYVPDRRMVSDGNVVTTTGITASIPMMLTLIEAIAGRVKAEAVAHDLGLGQWDARHASGTFRLTRPFATTVLANAMAFWKREELGVPLAPGMDEVSLALVADAWSRTYRSQATSYAASPGAVESRNGIRIVPDRTDPDWPADRHIPIAPDRRPADALDSALDAIAARYGKRTGHVVAMQLEYPERAARR